MLKIPNKTNNVLRELNETDQRRLVDYFNLLIEIDQREKARYAKLKKLPEGFPVDGEGRPCGLCFQPVYGDSSGWFDKWGFKCSNCQDAIDKRKIPGSLCGDFEHKKSIPDTVLAMELGIKVGVIRKYIREGKITARRIPNGPYVILQKDNPSLIEILGR